MARISLKHKITLVTTTILIVITSIIFLIIIPSIKYITRMKQNIENTEAELEENFTKIQLLKKSIRELDTIKEKTQNFYFATVAKGDELIVITELERIAEKYDISQDLNVSYSDDAPQNKENKKDNPHYIFTFHNQGSFQNQLEFLRELDKLPYYIIIDKLQLTKTNVRDENKLINLSFNGKVYIHQ